METWQAYLVLCPAALIGGAINSVAGGGTLITFPALLWALSGTPGATIIANATNTVALCPGAISGSWGYRRELRDLWGWVRWLALPSLIGGIAGSWIVVVAPESSFKAMIPWLIGLATALFIMQPRLTPTRKSVPPTSDPSVIGSLQNALTVEPPSPRYLWLVFGLQILIGLYGGYFGAGLGILMLSTLSLLQLGTIHQVNGLKTALAGMINGIAVVVFMVLGSVNWKLAVPMLISASIGGWLGATLARKMDRTVVRRIVIAIGVSLSTWYFAQQWYFATPDSPAGSVTSGAPAADEQPHGNQ